MELVQPMAAFAASVAAVTDLRARRIPNWLVGAGLVSGIGLHVWLDGPQGALLALLGAGLGLAILLPLYVVRALGAGDVKLLAALGAILGPALLVSVAIYAAIAGGVMSIVVLAHQRRLAVFFGEVLVSHRPPSLSGATAPYAVAIACGVYMSLVLPSLFG